MKLSIRKVLPFAALGAALCATCGARADSPADYVQEGLVAQWDGVENAGCGVHDADAAVWTDLLNGYSFKLANATVAADGVTFAGSTASYGKMDAAETAELFAQAVNGTVEVVAFADAGNAGAWVAFCAPQAYGMVLGATALNKKPVLDINGKTAGRLAEFDWNNGAINTYSVPYAASVSGDVSVNGVGTTMLETTSKWSLSTDFAWIGVRCNLYPFKGTIHAIRVYNRHLTADEIAQNRAVDEARFVQGRTGTDESRPQVRIAGIAPGATGVTVAVELLSAGADASTAAVSVTYAKEGDDGRTAVVSAAMAPGAGSVTVTGLEPGARYAFTAVATSSAGTGKRAGGSVVLPPLDGARLIGIPYLGTSFDAGLSQVWTIFDLFPATTPTASFWSYDNEIGLDAGAPRTVTGFVVSRSADTATAKSNTQNFRIYGSNDPDEAGEVLVENAEVLPNAGAEKILACDGVKGPYRYFRVGDKGKTFLLNVAPFSTDLHLTQYRPRTTVDGVQPGQEDSADDVSFAGKLEYAPAGFADVEVFVGRTDHGADPAAWAADALKVSVAGVKSGAKWSVKAPSALAAGRWWARAFAVSGNLRTASQASWPVLVGTSPYETVCYAPEGLASAAVANRYFYDGATAGQGSGSVTPVYAVFDLADPDKEVVAVRIWPYVGGSVLAWGSDAYAYEAIWSASPTAVDPSVATCDVQTSPRVIRGVAADPLSDWTTVADGTRWFDMELPSPPVVETYLNEDGVRFPKSLKMTNLNSWKVREFELRTLPRPPEPVAEAPFACTEATSASADFEGVLLYRGNAQSDCTAYLSCVESGADPAYAVGAEGLTSGAAVALQAMGLKGDTSYVWSILVSNAVAGVEVGSGTFRTKPGDAKPEATLVSVTTNADGTVTVAYELVSAGTQARADVYAVWGTAPDALTEEGLLKADASVGADETVFSGLPLGTRCYVAVRVRNAAGEESPVTAPLEVTTVGPCGLADVSFDVDGGVVATGTLAPRGLGDVELYFDCGEASGVYTESVRLGTVAAGAPASFSLSGALPAWPTVRGRLRAVNAAGGQSWTATTAESVLPNGFGLPLRSLDGPLKSYWAYAGVYNESWYESCPQFDLGSPRTVNGLRIMLNAFVAKTPGREQGFMLWGSNDNKDFTLVYTNAAESLPAGGTYLSLAIDADKRGPFRYFRFSNDKHYFGTGVDTRSHFSFVRLLSTDLAVEGRRPTQWSDPTPLGEADAGVRFAGRVLGAPNGEAHVYAFYAKKDLGDDAEAWKVRGTRLDLGTHAAGGSFDRRVADVRAGSWVCRYFVTDGTVEYLSPQSFSFTARSEAFFPRKVYLSAAEIEADKSARGQLAYDGSVETMPNVTGDRTVVFSLKEIPSGYRLVSVRIWAAGTANRMRLAGASADVSFAAVDLDGAATELTTVEGRTAMSVGALPDFDWIPAGGFDGRSELLEYASSATGSAAEIPIDQALARRHPTCLRVNRGNLETGLYAISEIELRLVREAGLAIIVR